MDRLLSTIDTAYVEYINSLLETHLGKPGVMPEDVKLLEQLHGELEPFLLGCDCSESEVKAVAKEFIEAYVFQNSNGNDVNGLDPSLNGDGSKVSTSEEKVVAEKQSTTKRRARRRRKGKRNKLVAEEPPPAPPVKVAHCSKNPFVFKDGAVASLKKCLDETSFDFLNNRCTELANVNGEKEVENAILEVDKFLDDLLEDCNVVEKSGFASSLLFSAWGSLYGESSNADDEVAAANNNADVLASVPVSLAGGSSDKESTSSWGLDILSSAKETKWTYVDPVIAEKKKKEKLKNMQKREKQAAKAARRAKPELDLDRECNFQVENVESDGSGKTGGVCLLLERICMDFGSSCNLLEEASLRLVTRRKYGLVGPNGCGKSTLLNHIPDVVKKVKPRPPKVMFVKQEADGRDDVTVLQSVLNADEERLLLLEKEKELLSNDSNPAELTKVQEQLYQMDAQGAQARAASILHGLQFTREMSEGPSSALSGGWRMRLALATALYLQPDLLLLDEPSNHLDLFACLWLEDYLANTFKGTLLVVSHDTSFLDNVVTDIIRLNRKSCKLESYKGNYKTYIETKRQQYLAQERAYTKQQEEISHMQAFVDKWLHNRFGYNRGLVQSRIKFIERKKTTEAIPKPENPDHEVRFSFPDPEDPVANPIVAIKDVKFKYPGSTRPIFKNLNLKICTGAKIAIVGKNGAGKSTLLKLLTGDILPIDGAVVARGKARIAYFSQHFVDNLSLDRCALEEIRLQVGPQAKEQELRKRCGAFGIQGELQTQKIQLLSGGQKARVGFSKLCTMDPHLLVFDEPTNHLDIESIGGLAAGILSLKRTAVIFVSHDSRLISRVCNELWHVDGLGNCEQFYGTFDEYKKKLLCGGFET